MRCIISGKVQGVFFRASTRNQAQRLGIVGYAKNLADGSVEVMACGENEALQELKIWLFQGSSASEVSNVECKVVQTQEFSDFQIL